MAVEKCDSKIGEGIDYVYIDEFVDIYPADLSEAPFRNRISYSEGDEKSFIPKVDQVGQYTYAICNKGSDFFACTVSVGYKQVIYSIMTITPQAMGEQFTIDILNSAINVTDQKVRENFQ